MTYGTVFSMLCGLASYKHVEPGRQMSMGAAED